MAIHRALAGVIAGQRQRHVATVAIQQPAQIARAARDILDRIIRIGDPETLGGIGHQLHQPHRALGAGGPTTPGGFGQDHRLDQERIDLMLSGIVENQRGEGGFGAGGSRCGMGWPFGG